MAQVQGVFSWRAILTLLLFVSISLNIFLESGNIIQYLKQHRPTVVSSVVHGTDTSKLLLSPLSFSGEKEFSEKTISFSSYTPRKNDFVELKYNLNGLCLLKGPASEISFSATSGSTYSVSLADFGKNCFSGIQETTIPVSRFGNDIYTPLQSLRIMFWYPNIYRIDIADISIVHNVLGIKTARLPNDPTSTINPTLVFSTETPIPSRLPTLSLPPTKTAPSIIRQTWPIQSVSSMKETKDKICNQDSASFINRWVDTAKALGVNYISVETPYDNPSCGSSVAYTKLWVDTIRAHGLSVWHRHGPLAFEGIYSTPKDTTRDYIAQITDYIKANALFFEPGDIFTPIPEPQNGGIQGITYCSQSICMFPNASGFNQWLRDVMTASEKAFRTVGLGGKIKVGYFGFDGFVTWGNNNPDWHGILEDATVKQMGEITIDHYPEAVGDLMKNDLHELQTKYPAVPIIIGEWGTITGGDTRQQILATMTAAKRKYIVGFNYWHMGMGGNEALINDDFSHKQTYDLVQSFFTGLR